MTENLSSDSMEILSQVLEEMKREKGSDFILREVNLSELVRRTGISRKKLRNLKKNDFKEKPKGRKGTKNKTTVLSGFTGVIDDYLRKDVANSEVIYDRLQEMGYQGGKTQIKVYIAAHKNLLPAKRQIVSPQGNRVAGIQLDLGNRTRWTGDS